MTHAHSYPPDVEAHLKLGAWKFANLSTQQRHNRPVSPGLTLRYYGTQTLSMIDHPIASEPGRKSVSFVRGTDPTHKKGLRTVAIIEFCKGLAGLAIAIGFLNLRNKDLWDIVESAMEFLHINPDRHFAQVILDYADRVTPAQLLSLALLAFAYSCLRFLEAYGLWKTRVWGEWLAIFSGLVYLPFEARALFRHSTVFHWAVIAVNLALVGYVAYVRISGIRHTRQQPSSRDGADPQERPYLRQAR